MNRRLQLAWIATALVTCLHTGRPHQSYDTVLAARKTGIGKVAHDAWSTIRSIASFMAELDGLQKM